LLAHTAAHVQPTLRSSARLGLFVFAPRCGRRFGQLTLALVCGKFFSRIEEPAATGALKLIRTRPRSPTRNNVRFVVSERTRYRLRTASLSKFWARCGQFFRRRVLPGFV
jgi:hypothetical protein